MATSWLRLWHDMPNDPKWRTIARISGQPVALVQAVFVHLLVDASRNVTRGHITVTVEDLASALDVTDEQIQNVLTAMQGRVIDGECLSGWDRRQPMREDLGSAETGAKSATERKREQRVRDKNAQTVAGSQTVTPGHEGSQQIRLDSDPDPDNKSSNPLSPPLPEPPPKPKRKTRLPEPFNVCGDMRKWATERAPAVHLINETEKFVNYWRGNGGTKADWVATWRTWFLKAQEDANRRMASPPHSCGPPPLNFDSTDWAKESIL